MVRGAGLQNAWIHGNALRVVHNLSSVEKMGTWYQHLCLVERETSLFKMGTTAVGFLQCRDWITHHF